MPMEGDAFISYAPPVMLSPGGRESEAIYATPYGTTATPYISPEQRWAAQASADESRLAGIKIPKATGGPEGLQLIPDISGGWTGTGGREGDRSYTQQELTGYRNYNPDTRILHGWDTAGNYLGSQYIPKDDPWSGLKDLTTKFILPAIGMYTGINALGGLFGAGGALGGVSGATQAAAEQAAAADIAGGMVPEFASNAAYDAAMNQAVAAGTAGVAPETLPSIFADTTATSIPTTDYKFTPSYELPAPTPVAPTAPVVPEAIPTTDYGLTPSYELAPPSVPQGIQAPVINEPITVGTAPIDYSLNVPSQVGLQLPSMPSLPNMGGAQGLTAAVPGGTVGELGFTPTGASPVLGDPASFINNPAVTGQPTIPSAPAAPAVPVESLMTEAQFASILKSLPGLLGGALGAASMPSSTPAAQRPTYQPASTMPQYSPEYFQQIQQRYNQILPSRPADVATPLSQWYNKPADSSVVSKLFGVI